MAVLAVGVIAFLLGVLAVRVLNSYASSTGDERLAGLLGLPEPAASRKVAVAPAPPAVAKVAPPAPVQSESRPAPVGSGFDMIIRPTDSDPVPAPAPSAAPVSASFPKPRPAAAPAAQPFEMAAPSSGRVRSTSWAADIVGADGKLTLPGADNSKVLLPWETATR